jgi:hypothetical protein
VKDITPDRGNALRRATIETGNRDRRRVDTRRIVEGSSERNMPERQ